MHKCVYSSNSYLSGGWEGCQPPHEMPAESPGSGGPAETATGRPQPRRSPDCPHRLPEPHLSPAPGPGHWGEGPGVCGDAWCLGRRMSCPVRVSVEALLRVPQAAPPAVSGLPAPTGPLTHRQHVTWTPPPGRSCAVPTAPLTWLPNHGDEPQMTGAAGSEATLPPPGLPIGGNAGELTSQEAGAWEGGHRPV